MRKGTAAAVPFFVGWKAQRYTGKREGKLNRKDRKERKENAYPFAPLAVKYFSFSPCLPRALYVLFPRGTNEKSLPRREGFVL
jgi:hypothetical protein